MGFLIDTAGGRYCRHLTLTSHMLFKIWRHNFPKLRSVKAVYVHVHILYEIFLLLLFVKGTRKSWIRDLRGRCYMSRHVLLYVTEDRFPTTQMVVSSYGKILNLRIPTSGQRHAPGFLTTLWNVHIKSIYYTNVCTL